MCTGYVCRICKGTEIPLVIRKTEPGRRDHIHPFPLCHHAIQGAVTGRASNSMPAQAHFPIHKPGSIRWCHIVCHRCLHFRGQIPQTFVLHIADHRVRCLHLAPGIHLLQDLHCLSLVQIPQNGTFDTTLDTDLGLLRHFHGLPDPPLGIHLYISVIGHICIICEQLHVIRCHIQSLSFQETHCICPFMGTLPVPVARLAKLGCGGIIRLSIQQLLLIQIHIEAFI